MVFYNDRTELKINNIILHHKLSKNETRWKSRIKGTIFIVLFCFVMVSLHSVGDRRDLGYSKGTALRVNSSMAGTVPRHYNATVCASKLLEQSVAWIWPVPTGTLPEQLPGTAQQPEESRACAQQGICMRSPCFGGWDEQSQAVPCYLASALRNVHEHIWFTNVDMA